MKISLIKFLLIEIILAFVLGFLTYPKTFTDCYFGLCYLPFSIALIFSIISIFVTIAISQIGDIHRKNHPLVSVVIILVVIFLGIWFFIR